jgi:PAS domain S-box-containing protein
MLLLCCGSLAQAQNHASAAQPARVSPKSITVVLDNDYPPYIFRDDKGEFHGILKDTWALWQEKTGIEVKLLPMDWKAAQDMFLAGRADVIDTIFKTPERQNFYDFTAPYVSIPVSLFFHKSVSGIVNAESVKGFTVGVKEGDACIDYLVSQGVEQFKRYPTYSAVLGAAKAGEVRVFCMDEPPGLYLLYQLGLTKDYLHSGSISVGQFHRAVAKDNSAMLALVEQGFASITPAELQKIVDHWYGSTVHELGESTFMRMVRDGVLGIVFLTAVLILWNLMLRRRVREKTLVLSNTVAELKLAQHASEKAFKHLNAIACNVPGMVYQFLLRPDGTSCFPYASEAIREIYRLTPEQVVHDASAAFALGHPEDVHGVIVSIHESARNLTAWQREYRIRFDDGTVRWLLGNARPELQEDGGVLWNGLITDITERREMGEKFRQLSRAVEQAPLSIVITNLDGNIVYVNPRFTQLSGFAEQEVFDANPRFLQSGQTPKSVYTDLWQTLLDGRVWQGELFNRKKNGDLFTELAVIAPVLDEAGIATHYVAIKQDITHRKHDEQLVQDSLREKVALLHEVHHRVKNNLQVITSLLRLEARSNKHESAATVLQDMQHRVHAMALLHESLYRAGNFATLDLDAYLRQLATQIFRGQSGQGARVQLALELQPCCMSMDQATTCGLLVNELMTNALKHGFTDGRSGTVTLRLEPAVQSGRWTLTVQDTGVGLPDDFEKRRSQSLGLQLADDLAHQLGATLQRCAGNGACFTVTFTPVVLSSPAA